jgi:hypothetical protein
MKLLIDFDTNAENQIQAKKQHTAPATVSIRKALEALQNTYPLDYRVVNLLDTSLLDQGKVSGWVPIDWLAGFSARVATGSGRMKTLPQSPGSRDIHGEARRKKSRKILEAFTKHGGALGNLLRTAKLPSAGDVSSLDVPVGQLQPSLSLLAEVLQLREGDLPTLLVCIGVHEQFSKDVTDEHGLRGKHLLVRTVENKLVLYSAGKKSEILGELDSLNELFSQAIGDKFELETRFYD